MKNSPETEDMSVVRSRWGRTGVAFGALLMLALAVFLVLRGTERRVDGLVEWGRSGESLPKDKDLESGLITQKSQEWRPLVRLQSPKPGQHNSSTAESDWFDELERHEQRIAARLSSSGIPDRYRLTPYQFKETTLLVSKAVRSAQDRAAQNMVLKQDPSGDSRRFVYKIEADPEFSRIFADDLATKASGIGGDAFSDELMKEILGWKEVLRYGLWDVSIRISPGRVREDGRLVRSRVSVNFYNPATKGVVDYYSTSYSSLARTTRLFELEPDDAVYDEHPSRVKGMP